MPQIRQQRMSKRNKPMRLPFSDLRPTLTDISLQTTLSSLPKPSLSRLMHPPQHMRPPLPRKNPSQMIRPPIQRSHTRLNRLQHPPLIPHKRIPLRLHQQPVHLLLHQLRIKRSHKQHMQQSIHRVNKQLPRPRPQPRHLTSSPPTLFPITFRSLLFPPMLPTHLQTMHRPRPTRITISTRMSTPPRNRRLQTPPRPLPTRNTPRARQNRRNRAGPHGASKT